MRNETRPQPAPPFAERAPSPTSRPMTADELLHMPDDNFRHELVRGELRTYPFNDRFHGKYALTIGVSLGLHVKANRLGKTYATGTGFELAHDHVRAPDVAFVRAERAAAAKDGPEGYFPGPPDLAVEVISPTDVYEDVEEKLADWLAAGTLAVIIVVANPRRRTVKIYRRSGFATLNQDDILEVQDVVPGWRMPVADIFK